MQVSGVEIPQQTGGEKSQTKPTPSASGLFDALLQGANARNGSLSRLESGTGLAQQIATGETQPSKPDYVGAPETENTSSQTDETDDDAPEDESVEETANETEPARAGNQTASAVQVETLPTTDSTNRTASTAAAAEPAVVHNPESAQGGETTTNTNSDSKPDSAAKPETVAEQIATTASPAAVATATAGPAAQSATTKPAQTAAAPTVSQTAATPEQAVASRMQNAPLDEKPNVTSRLTASVTDTPQQIISRPVNTLSAAATVTAQTNNKQTAANTAQSGKSETRAESSGNLLLNDAPNKPANTNNAARANAPQTPPNAPSTGTTATNPSPDAQPVPVAPLLPAQQAAAAANRPASSLLRGGEPITLGTISNGLAAGSTTSSAAARVAAPPPPNVPPRVLTEQIAVQVQKSIAQGQDQIKIQLKPAELGRVEIKLDVMQDGRVAATIVAERPETLELLQRDARGLQQALQDAGLKSSSANLNFNLGGGNESGGQQSANNGGGEAQPGENTEVTAENSSEPEQRRSGNSLIDVEV